MPVFVSLIRGINVGGNKMIRMEDLRAIHESLGFKNVRTFLQSGNVVFKAAKADPKKIEAAIEKKLKMDVSVIVRTADELRDAIARSPFSLEGRTPGWLLIMFLSAEPKGTLPPVAAPEEAHLSGRELYLYYGNGAGRSKLSGALLERKLGVVGTARNWNTVTKLLELADTLA